MELKETVKLANGDIVTFSYRDTDSEDEFENITQSYGICFTNEGEVVLIRSTAFYNNMWLLPGGTIEEGETPIQTLYREVVEEADITLLKAKLLGGQNCEYPEKPEVKKHSQLRYAAIIDEIKEQTPDPANGVICERKFIPAVELNKYLNWGSIGERLQERAIEWFEKQKE